jgi:hypothetical protein
MTVIWNAALLQTTFQFIDKQDTFNTIITYAFIAGFIVILVIGGIIVGNKSKGKSPKTMRRYNSMVFKRISANAGLSRPLTEALEHLVKACKVSQPFLIFSNPGLLDQVLEKGIYAVSRKTEWDENQREKRLNEYFKIKEIIERSSKRGVGITSTNLMKSGQDLVITLPDGKQLQTKIIANLKNMLACEVPLDTNNKKIILSRGIKLKALFWREGDSGYVFYSKILSYDRIRGKDAVLIKHSKTLKRNQQRKFRRRPLGRNCIFYPVEVIITDRTRRNQRKRAFVQKNFRHLGILNDISAGGCSISSQTPLQRGRLLMVEFELGDRRNIVAYGKVQRLNRAQNKGGAMHIIFTKVSSANLNNIYSYVYSYIRPPKDRVLPRQLTGARDYRTIKR